MTDTAPAPQTVPIDSAAVHSVDTKSLPSRSETNSMQTQELDAERHTPINDGPSSSPKAQKPLAEPSASAVLANERILQPTPLPYDLMPISITPQGTAHQMSVDNPQMDRPLNVTDALSYLDAVKIQFQDRPDVYNRFLDIMKDFKSQIIDTPGVIQRVSSLFRGHPSLIQGFNTFLPVGYRIECSTNSQETNLITVTTPTGTTTQSAASYADGPITFTPTGTQSDGAGYATGPVPTPSAPSGSMLLGPSPSITEMFANGASNRPPMPLVLEPALHYVQKIKVRFVDDPETYKMFLEALSASSDENELLSKVRTIFRDEVDLFEDFRIFLATKRDSDARTDVSMDESRVPTPVIESRSSRKKADLSVASSSGTGAVSGSHASLKRKRKPVEKDKEKEPLTSSHSKSGASKKGKQSTSLNDIASSSRVRPPSAHGRSPHLHHHRHHALSASHQNVPQVLPPLPPHAYSSAHDDSHFFDRVKRSMDSRETFNEFLKLVNLFTQDIIDRSRLVRESRTFLGNGDLMAQFVEILGWDERKEGERIIAEEQEQAWAVRPARALDVPRRLDLNARYGSYRRLPANEVSVTCSGRDDMCKSVLNDEWVSHPTFASEDSGFVAHKKNVYEEALHRSEEERHEYDFHIEAITRTISMLEPINNKIAQLSNEERNNFKLKPNLGGVGKSIHQRVIKKIYGRDPGLEVIQAMQDSPALAIPVVLSRLKQKEEEWKRAQREWNKVWREVDARNFQKSLDHQGITFKANDKKAITAKAFLNQIEATRDEQIVKRAALVDPLFARPRPRHQLEYTVDDFSVLADALKLTLSFLDRTQNQISFAERRRIEGFFRVFVPSFFMLDSPSFNSAFVARQETMDSENSDELSLVDEAEATSVASSSRTGRSTRKQGGASGSGDLRKKLLKSEQAKSTTRRTRAQELASPLGSRPASPALPEQMQLDSEDGPSQRSAKHGGTVSGAAVSSPEKPAPRRGSFFTNTTFYVFMRLLELLYSRLAFYKNLSSMMATQPVGDRLGIHLAREALDVVERPNHASHYYDLLLESCERLFDNEVEQIAFEDQMRHMFGPKDAYRIFTVDKLIGAMIKQVQTVLSDRKSLDIYEIMKRERTSSSPTSQDLVFINVETILGPDESVFRIDWRSDSKTIAIQLLGKDDSSSDDSEVLSGRWQAYVDAFVSGDSAVGVTSSKTKSPFLRRNLPSSLEHPRVLARGGLEIKVCVRTYRLFFVPNTEDFLWRKSTRDELENAERILKDRNAVRSKWLESA